MKRIVYCITFFLVILFLPNIAEATKIDNMDINITVLDDGKIELNQVIDYRVSSTEKQVTVPIGVIYEDMPENIEIYGLQSNTKYTEISANSTLKMGTYKMEIPENEFIERAFLKIYLKTNNGSERINIKYVLPERCTNYQNIGELSFSLYKFENDIGRINTKINFPNNDINKDLIAESNNMGQCNIIDNKVITFVRENFKKDSTGRIKVLYDLENTINNKQKKNIVYSGYLINEYNEKKNIELQKTKKMEFIQKLEKYTTIAIPILIIYWLVLLYKYEYDKRYKVLTVNEDELFEKFNPLLAGCIEGSRTPISRDIIAVILNLVNKKVVKLDIRNSLNQNENYEYKLIKNQDNEIGNMDQIEQYVYNWIFDGADEVNLTDRLKQIVEDKNAKYKFEKLYNISLDKMQELGANKSEIPKILQIFNDILLISSIVYVIATILYTIDIKSFAQILIEVGIIGIIVLPMWIRFAKVITTKLKMISDRILLGKPKWMNTAVVIPIMVFFIVTVIFGQTLTFIVMIARDITFGAIIKYFLLISICAIISFTDGLMLKNNKRMIEYYSQLHVLKKKVQDTLLNDKDIEYIELWDRYLTYAISFGITKKIQKRVKYIDLDNDLLNM